MNANSKDACVLTVPGAEKARILVIRFKQVADVVLTSILCNTLKKTFPKARVDFLIQDSCADLFVDHPYIDRVIALAPEQRNNPFKFWKTIRQITSEDYDLVVDAQSTVNSELLSLLARKNAICIGRRKRHRGYFFTHKVDSKPFKANKVEERLQLLWPLKNMGFDIKRHDQMIINVPSSRREHYKREMQYRGVDFARPIFALSVTTQLDFKKWPMDYLEEVVTYCLQTFNAQIVLSAGSKHERAEVSDFVQRIGNNADVYSDIELASLMDVAALFTNCDLYIGSEGGPGHIAHAVGLPSVSIFSPSSKKSEWLPRNSRQHQGVEWQDLDDSPAEEQWRINNALQAGSEQYRNLYSKITPRPVIERIDDVTDFVGIQRVD